jgi:hypothetical protein
MRTELVRRLPSHVQSQRRHPVLAALEAVIDKTHLYTGRPLGYPTAPQQPRRDHRRSWRGRPTTRPAARCAVRPCNQFGTITGRQCHWHCDFAVADAACSKRHLGDLLRRVLGPRRDQTCLLLQIQELAWLGTTVELWWRCRIRTCVGVSRRIYSLSLPGFVRSSCVDCTINALVSALATLVTASC